MTVALLLAAAAPAGAAAVEREVLNANPEPTGLLNITPIRFQETVLPGNTSRFEITIFNDAETPAQVDLRAVDLDTAQDPTLLAVPAENAEFGASEWIDLPVNELELAPFEQVKVLVPVTAPQDAPVGDSYGAIEFDIQGESVGGDAGEDTSGARLKVLGIVQLLLTVPGEVVNDLELVDASVEDAFFLGGPRFIVYETTYRNEGTVSETVTGSVVVRSLFGNVAAELPLRELIVIRGSERQDRVVWSNPPRFGVFTAEVQITTEDGSTQTLKTERVVILPPWWVWVLIAVSLVGPAVFLWWRRRQEWLLYLEYEDWDELDEYDEAH